MVWRENIDNSIRPYLEKLINQTFTFKEQYEKSSDKSKSQLWIALAIISKQIHELDLKLRYFEKILKDKKTQKPRTKVKSRKKKK